MDINLKLKLKYTQIIKLTYGFIGVVFLVAAYWLSIFLYNNFYQVLTHAEIITVLRKEVAVDIVDAALFEKVLERLEEKQKILPFEIGEVSDVFSSDRSRVEISEPEMSAGNELTPNSGVEILP